jgi:hypothetical protein
MMQGKTEEIEEKRPTATLTTISLTWTVQGGNPGLRGKKLAVIRLIHGTAFMFYLFIFNKMEPG